MCPPSLWSYQFGCFTKHWPSKNLICGHQAQLHLGQLVEKYQSLKASFTQGEQFPPPSHDCAHVPPCFVFTPRRCSELLARLVVHISQDL